MRVGDEMVEQTIPSTPKDAYERITGMIRLRDNIRHLLDIQLEGCPDEILQKEQAELNRNYDAFVKKYGFLNSSTNNRLFREDADSALLFSAENISEDKKSATKADIFSKRTIRPYTVATQTDDCFEALQISRNEKGYVDIAYIEELTKKDYDTVLAELGNAVFRNPVDVDPQNKYSGFQTQEEYLSGEVVKKLQQVRYYVAMGGKEYERNVKALEEVQPVPLKASEISVKLGASWVDKDIYKQCICEMLSLPRWACDGVEVFYNKHDGSWRIDKESYARQSRWMEINQVYGTERANAFRLFEDCMNQKATQIYDMVEDSDGKTKRVLNQAETIAAREKQNKIQEFFKSWIYADPERRDHLEEKYNSIFNKTRVPTYDGSHLKFPEMNPDIELRPHQKNAVHRITSTGQNSTGHKSRLNRDLSGRFGSPEYATEELRAEIASLFIEQEFGIEVDEHAVRNNAAYIGSWKAEIEEDPDALFKAITDADRIAKYIVEKEKSKKKEAKKYAIVKGENAVGATVYRVYMKDENGQTALALNAAYESLEDLKEDFEDFQQTAENKDVEFQEVSYEELTQENSNSATATEDEKIVQDASEEYIRPSEIVARAAAVVVAVDMTERGVESLTRMSDRDVVDKARSVKGGDTFEKLYNGEKVFESEGKDEKILMMRIGMFCNGDTEQAVRVFKSSGMFREDKPNSYYMELARQSIQSINTMFEKPPIIPANTGKGKFGINAKT